MAKIWDKRAGTSRHLIVDFSELIEFKERLQELAEGDLTVFLKRQIQKIADELCEKARNKTPVDTGRLKSSWHISRVFDRGKYYEVWVFNNARSPQGAYYPSWVELGHKTRNGGWVEGRFMMEKAGLEVEADMPKIIERELTKFLKERLEI